MNWYQNRSKTFLLTLKSSHIVTPFLEFSSFVRKISRTGLGTRFFKEKMLASCNFCQLPAHVNG